MSDSVENNESKKIKTEDSADASQSVPSQDNQRKHSGGVLRSLKRLIFLSLYLVFLITVVVGILAAVEYYAYLQIKESPLGAPYRDKDMRLARRSTVTPRPLFGYEPTAGWAATHNTKLGNAFEYINEENFKDFKEVPLEKPKNEYPSI